MEESVNVVSTAIENYRFLVGDLEEDLPPGAEERIALVLCFGAAQSFASDFGFHEMIRSR